MPKAEQPEGTERLATEQQEYYFAKLLESVKELKNPDYMLLQFIAQASDSVRNTWELTEEIKGLLEEMRDLLRDIKSELHSISIDADTIAHYTDEIRDK